MKKGIFISLIVIFVLISLFARLSLGAIEIEKCKDCHGTIKPIPSYDLTKNCLTCHDTHGTPRGCCQPNTRDPEKVHDIHANAGKKVTKGSDCTRCHQSPVSCTNCHGSHSNMVLNVNDTNSSICTDCHGKLPQIGGHEEFRNSILKYKHNWTNCGTCHLSPSKDPITGIYEFKLHFKDLLTTTMGDSTSLCKICHSPQYEKMQEGGHGASSNKCIDCHNPHTTKLSGPEAIVIPKETPVNISTRVESSKEWAFENIPILNNTVALIIIAIILVAMVSEYILSKYEKGTKVAYNMVKVQAGEDTLKTLEVKLKDQNIDTVRKILEEYNINIIGMTMKKEEDKEEYKYVIFIDTGKLIMDEKGENDLINRISSGTDIKLAEFTDKYEL